MKFKILSLMLLSLMGATSVKNGEDAPLFNLLNQDDQTVSLKNLKAKKSFWNGLIMIAHL